MNIASELFASSSPGFALELAIKATLLLAIVLSIWRVLGRYRPLIGSAIGHACLLGLAVLPFSTTLIPTFSLPILRATSPARVPDRSLEGTETGSAVLDPTDAIADEIDVARAGLSTVGPVLSPVGPIHASPMVSPSTNPSIDLATFLVGTYALIVLAMLARLVASLVGVERLRRSSVAVNDSAWLDALARLAQQLGIGRPVALARSSRVGVPVVVGWLRPMILLPDPLDSDDPAEPIEAILLHELAHVRRGDYAWNLLLRVIEAAYWPHPLVWLLGRAVVESRERVCDAFCVHQMGGPSGYREALLAMAEGLTHRPGPALGLAMARASKLARRVAEIDRGRSEARCLPRWPAWICIMGFVLASTAALGPARITRAESRADLTLVNDLPPAPVAIAQEPKAAAVPVRAPAAGRVFKLRVVAAETGKPVPKAEVRVWMGLRGEDFRTTDDEGRLELIYATGTDDLSFGVDAWGDGFAQQRHNWGRDPKIPVPDQATIKLQPGESLGGSVQDEEGRPIAGAAVYLWSHNYKKKDPTELLYDLRAITGPDGRWHTGGAPQTTGDLLGIYITHPDFLSDREYVAGREKPPIDLLRAGKAVSVMKKGVPIEGSVLDEGGKPVEGALVISTQNPGTLFNSASEFAVRTNKDGWFRTGQVQAGEWHLVVRAKGHAPSASKFKVGSAVPLEEIRLQAPHTFRARVVDPEGKPIEGAFVNIDSWRGYRCLGVYLYTDSDGRVRWDDAPDDRLLVNVDRQGYLGFLGVRAEPDNTEITWTLAPALLISGIVRDSETRKAVETAEIEYGAVDPASGEVSRWEKPPTIGWSRFTQGYLNARFAVQADAYKIRITADGYQPFVSRAFRRDERVVLNYDVTLVPGTPAGPLATAIRPDGRPLAGARIYRGRINENLSINDGQVTGRNLGRQAVTDADGRFAIPQDQVSTVVLILGDDCFAYANSKALADSPRLQARAYGRIEGRYLIGDRITANRPIELTGLLQDDSTRSVALFFTQKTRTDAEGRFAFDKVVPIPGLRIARRDPQKTLPGIWSMGEPVHVEDGQTASVVVGGRGKAIIGRFEAPEGWDKPVDFTDRCRVSVSSNRGNSPYPLELIRGKTSLNDHAWSDWSQAWRKTPEGRAYADARVAIAVSLAPDGSFRIDDVPPGDYRITIRVNEENTRDRGPFAEFSREIVIPPIPGGRSDDPLDLGPLRLKARTYLKAGDPAPAFVVTTVDGKRLSVPNDFRGKFLLLDIGAIWEDQSRLQVTRMNEVFARFGKDDRFALLSLVMAADRPDSRTFVAEKGEAWPQAIVGPLSNPIAEAYGIEESNIFGAILIGPDGKIVARDLYYQKIGEAIAQGLQGPGAKP
jgi:beta-lactamase regulating signal transducer with metallopeptidase domain/protocatechuate 3,4-dioxygenase beta subunit